MPNIFFMNLRLRMHTMTQKEMALFSLLTILAFASSIFLSCNKIQNNTEQEPSDEVVAVEEEIEIQCKTCSGTGSVNRTCSTCSGEGTVESYEFGTTPSVCTICCGTGKVRCERCEGNRFIRCKACDGHGGYQCTACHGTGIMVVLSEYYRCNCCKGSGYLTCDICQGEGRLKCCSNGLSTCPNCWGSGTKGNESYSEKRNVDCSNCNGTGNIYCICEECGGTGFVIEKRIVQKSKTSL